MGLARLELATSPLSGVRSNHLSYSPVASGVLMPTGSEHLEPGRSTRVFKEPPTQSIEAIDGRSVLEN